MAFIKVLELSSVNLCLLVHKVKVTLVLIQSVWLSMSVKSDDSDSEELAVHPVLCIVGLATIAGLVGEHVCLSFSYSHC